MQEVARVTWASFVLIGVLSLAGCFPTEADGWARLAIKRNGETLVLLVCDRVNAESVRLTESIGGEGVRLWTATDVGELGPLEEITQTSLLGTSDPGAEPTMSAGSVLVVGISPANEPSDLVARFDLRDDLSEDSWLTPQGEHTSHPCGP